MDISSKSVNIAKRAGCLDEEKEKTQHCANGRDDDYVDRHGYNPVTFKPDTRSCKRSNGR